MRILWALLGVGVLAVLYYYLNVHGNKAAKSQGVVSDTINQAGGAQFSGATGKLKLFDDLSEFAASFDVALTDSRMNQKSS